MRRSNAMTNIAHNFHNLLSPTKHQRKYFHRTIQSSHSNSFIDSTELSNNQNQEKVTLVHFLQSHGLQENYAYKFTIYHKANQEIIQLRECPLCPPHKNVSTNLWTLGIFANNGGWNCFRCSNHGKWSDLVQIFNMYGNHCGDALGAEVIFDNDYIENEESEIEQIVRNEYISESEINYQNEILFKERPLLNRLIKERNLSEKCFRDYKCGLQYQYLPNLQHKQQCLTFPMYQYSYKHNRFIATKYKSRCVSNGLKQFGQFPVYNQSGLFGFDLCNTNENKIVISEGEYDSMAIYYGSEYRISAVSLPNGVNNIPDQVMKQLIDFYDEFVLFLDWDEPGQRHAHILKEKIETAADKKVNVQIVAKEDNLPDVKDANDILMKHENDGHNIMKDILHRYHI